MWWHESWTQSFGFDPHVADSLEESLQDILVDLIAGHRCTNFVKYEPTPAGRDFLLDLWREQFGGSIGSPDWFISEFKLEVSPAWLGRFKYSYGSPDLACGDDTHVLVIELKARPQSYKYLQIVQYLDFARYQLPQHRIDMLLLAPQTPGATHEPRDGERYAETNWSGVASLLWSSFPRDPRVEALRRFLAASPEGRWT